MVHAWDGWCNYATNENVEFVVPEEGSDLFADVLMIIASSENKEAAHAFINFILEPENHVQVAELVLYKVPNGAGDGSARPGPDRGVPEPRDLAGGAARRTRRTCRSARTGRRLWTQTVAEIKAA